MHHSSSTETRKDVRARARHVIKWNGKYAPCKQECHLWRVSRARIVREAHSEIALCDILDQGKLHYSHIMYKFDCYDQLVCGAAFTDIWKHLKVKEEVLKKGNLKHIAEGKITNKFKQIIKRKFQLTIAFFECNDRFAFIQVHRADISTSRLFTWLEIYH